MAIGVKKWFMLQMWRVQQIAAVMTLVLMAINLSLQVYDYMSWRSGVFSSPYSGALIILITLGLIIWALSIVWDTKLRMWREQMIVLVEKNPYTKEKMSPKEIVQYKLLWLPLVRKIGESDPELREYGEKVQAWVDRVLRDDPSVVRDVEELTRYVEGGAPKHGGRGNRGSDRP